MKNSLGKRKGPKGFFLAFLIVALAFLAVGLGTLGSAYGTGDAFELRSKTEQDIETPSVTFQLSDLTETDAEGKSVTTRVRLMQVYVNLATIYADAGTYATLRVERSTSGTTFSTGLNAVFENYFTPVAEIGEDGKPVKDIPAPDATDEFFRFVAPFSFPDTDWRVSLYPYIRLSLTGTNPNVLINEVVFVGEKLDSSYEGTGETCLIPAKIYEATPIGESAESAKARANALLDAQAMPTEMQSTFGRFSDAEVSALKTIAEMRLGNTYAADAEGKALDTYHIEQVYGALGTDILALGTLMFGMSPFGLRFFPMLASFGTLIALARLVRRLTRSEKAGLVFTVLYALSCLTLGYGHLGTPLMLAVFFFAVSLNLVHAFYADGMKKGNFLHALPLLLAGLCGAAAICVNGAFVIPMAGVVALFVLGMVRQQKAKRYRLEKALAEDAAAPSEAEAQEEGAETPERRAAKVAAEFRFKNRVAPIVFGVALVIGAFLLALLGMLPAYYAYLKGFGDPSSPSNVFTVAWQAFAGGFTGANAYAVPAWSVFAQLFRGTGNWYALTAVTINPAALIAGGLGLLYTLVRLVLAFFAPERDKAWRAALRRNAVIAVLFVLALIMALAVKEAAVFVALLYLDAMLAGACLFGGEYTGKAAKAVRIVNIVALVLLADLFASLAFFTFSIPLPANFMAAIFG